MEKKSINYSRIGFVFLMSLACSLLFFPSVVLAARLVPAPAPAPAAATAAAARSAPAPVKVVVPVVNLAPTIALIATAKTNKQSYDSASAGSPQKNQAKNVYEASVAAAVLSLQTLATTAKPEAAGNNKTKILGLIADEAANNLDQAIGSSGAILFTADLKDKIKTLLVDLSGFGKNVNDYFDKWTRPVVAVKKSFSR